MKDLLELLPGRTSPSIKHYKDRHLKELNEKYKINGDFKNENNETRESKD